MLTLSALNGQDKGRVFQLTGEQPELMGRQAPNIKLTDAQTSRRHAEIILQNNTWLIRDLGSTNGTWVNGQRIMQITELEVGDRLVVGRHQFRVSAIDDLPAPTPQPKAPQAEPVIGHEDLAAIGAGVDLSESLSADLLDDDGQGAVEIPEEALSDSGIRPAPPADRPAAKAQDDIDDAVIDLDALLGDDAPNQPDDSPGEKAPDDAFDLDALLALDDADQPDDAPTKPQAPPKPPAPVQASSAAVPTPTDGTPDTADTPDDLDIPDVPDNLDDNILDLDAVLGGLASEQDEDSPAIEDVDIPASSAPPVTDDSHEAALAHDDPSAAQDDEDLDEEADDLIAREDAPDSAREDDSLIDIDILASAKPASDWQGGHEARGDAPAEAESPAPDIDAEPTTNEAPPDDDLQEMDEVLGDLAAELDSADDAELSPDAFLVDGSDSGLGFDPDADEQAASSHDTDASLDVEEEDAEHADTDDDDDDVLGASSSQVNEAEKGLLLSPQEQEQAVTGYRRSKIKSLLGLLLLLGVLGAAGWYGFNYYVSHANATSTRTTPPAERDTPPTNERPADNTPTTTQDPQTPRPQASQNQPPEPVTPTPRPKPEQATPPIAYPDPFADIAPAFTQPQPDETQPQTPAKDSDPAPAQPQPEPQPQPDPVAPPVPAPDTTPTPDSTPATPDAVDDAPAGEPAADVSPVETIQTDEPPAPAPSSSALGTIKEPQTTQVAPQQEDAPSPKAEVDLITGAIDAQNKPGDRVTAQAEYAGARKVVYLVDASGSLVDSFPYVLSELNLAIDELTGDKAFTVIFFGSDGITEVPPVGLKWADNQNKRKVREWVTPDQGNVNAWGRGDLIQALQRAVAYSPDDLVILTDNLTGRQSTQEDIDALLARIETLVDGKVEKVHVMQFFDRDPQQVLKTIAEKFHGTYSLILAKPSTSAQSSADDPLGQR